MTDEQIFDQAIELAEDEREKFLREACGEEPERRERVEALIAAHERVDSLLDEAGPGSTADLPVDSASPSRQIGNYKLIEKIGEGGMGSVYVAEQLRPVKRMVALKVIRAGMDSKQVVARFEAERQSLAMMDHPNIAKVLDAGQTERGEPYFVMELVKGVPITSYCDDNRLAPEQRVKLMVDVCSAVQHAHQKGIIHRDLKPSNILVALYDDRPVPKVIDFGVAKATHQKLTEKTLHTQLGQIVGTLEYMSPEQAVLNQLDVDTRTDVYSLGVILYELLVGETPLDGRELRRQGLEQMLRTIREQEPARPSLRLSSQGKAATQTAAYRNTNQPTLTRTLRGDLDWIVMKALEKDRKRRYDSASRLSEDLEHYLTGTAVEARPPSRLYQVRKYLYRNRAGLSIASVIVGVLTVAVVLVSHQRNVAVGRLHELQQTLEELAFNEACNGEMKHFLRWNEQLRVAGVPQTRRDTLKAIALFASGAESAAADLLTEVLALDPENQLAHAALLWSAHVSGDYTTMASAARKVNELGIGDTDSSRLLISYATLWQPGDADSRAIEQLNDILEAHPRWGFAYLSRSLAYSDLCGRTKEADHLVHSIEDMRVARTYMPESEYVKLEALYVYIIALSFLQASPNALPENDVQYCSSEASRIADEFFESLPSFEGSATALMYFRLTEDPRADQLEARLEHKFENHRLEVTEAWASRRFKELISDRPKDPFPWMVFQILAYKELENDTSKNDEVIQRLCEEMSMHTRGNGNLCEISLDAYVLLPDQEGRKRIAEQARNEPFIWEWEKRTLDYHVGLVEPQQLIDDAFPFPDQMCIAHFTVGLDWLSKGRRDLAIEHFKAVEKTGRFGWIDYHAAKALLKRLEDPSDDFPRWIPEISQEGRGGEDQ